MRNFKTLVKMANKEIEKVKAMLEEKAEVFATRNLKLYDVAFNEDLQEEFGLSDDQYSEAFYWFCNDSYSNFEEWMLEERIDNRVMQYIGRSSSFNLIPMNDIIQLDRYGDIDFENTIYQYILIDIGHGSSIGSVLDADGLISLEEIRKLLSSLGNEFYCLTVEEACPILKDALEYLTDNIVKMFEYSLEDVEKVHGYLKDFKENQVEYFREYLEFYAEKCVIA